MTERAGPRSFARFIETAGDGDFHQELSEGLQELSQSIQSEALRTNAKIKGKLSLTMTLSCDPRGVIGIDCDVAVKKPRAKRATAQAWINKDGNVVFEHPRQQKLPLREVTLERDREHVDLETGEVRSVREV